MLTGRKEHTTKIKEVTKSGLEGYPAILTEYFEKSAGSQATSKSVFVGRIKRFCNFLQDAGFDIYNEKCWSRVTENEITDWIISCRYKANGKENSSKTLYDYLETIRNFCKFLVRRKLMPENPCPTREEMKGVIPTEIVERKVIAMTPDETDIVTESIKKNSPYPARDIAIFKIGCRYGLRAQALSEIDISDVDFAKKELIVIEKGNFTRHIKLGASTLQLIKECIEEREREFGHPDTDALFVKCYHGEVSRICKSHIAKLLQNNTEELDKHITPHKMRSTCITITYEHTGDIFDAARKAGHRNPRNTMLYINTDKKDEKLAEDIDDII